MSAQRHPPPRRSCGGVRQRHDALLLALRALEIGGDEVIVPDFSFISTAEVVAEVGATPVFVDIHPDTFQIDPSSAERARAAKTKAVMVVHLFGQCANMDALVPWARCPWRSPHRGQRPKPRCDLERSDRAGSSGHAGGHWHHELFPAKPRRPWRRRCCADAQRSPRHPMRRLANHGAERKYHHLEVGCNSRLDGLQAAFLSVKLRHWGDMIARRQAAADRYDALLAQREGIAAPVRSAFSTPVPPVLRVVARRHGPRRLATRPEASWHPHGRVHPTPLVATCLRTGRTHRGGRHPCGTCGGGTDFGLAHAHRAHGRHANARGY